MAEYLKIPEVAQRLDVSEKTARRYVKMGELPSVFLGGAYRVSEEDLEKYLKAAKVQPGDGSGKGLASQPDSEEAALSELALAIARRGRRIVERSRREGPSESLSDELQEYTAEARAVRRLLGGRDIYGRRSEELAEAIDTFEEVEGVIQGRLKQDVESDEGEKAEARRFRKPSPEDSSAEERAAKSETA